MHNAEVSPFLLLNYRIKNRYHKINRKQRIAIDKCQENIWRFCAVKEKSAVHNNKGKDCNVCRVVAYVLKQKRCVVRLSIRNSIVCKKTKQAKACFAFWS